MKSTKDTAADFLRFCGECKKPPDAMSDGFGYWVYR